MSIDPRLVEALAVTAELTGTQLSPAAARILADDLGGYSTEQVLAALVRCRRELRGRLTVAEIVARIDDGRPGPDEAWGMVPRDEGRTVVWTDEMRAAFGAAAPLLDEGDRAGARAAFREAYVAAVIEARNDRRPVEWSVSLGHDRAGREGAILEAVQRGRLTHEQAERYLPDPDAIRTIAEPQSVSGFVAKVLEHLDREP